MRGSRLLLARRAVARPVLAAPLLLALVLLPLATGRPALAQAAVIDAPSAQGIAAAGGLLVDIRTPHELAATGRPAGSVHVPLQGDDMTFSKDFAAQVAQAAGDDRNRPIALIDADGRRAAFAARLLASQGFTQVFSVGEGLLGSNLGPGWLARQLPVERR